MVRFAVTGTVVALLALTGCGGARQEREKKEQEAAAAEKKLAEGRAFLEGLESEKKLLATQLIEARTRLAESRTALRRTLAGAAYLAEQKGNALVLDEDMSAALEGFRLEDYGRQKDRDAIAELANLSLRDMVPCVRQDTQEESEEGCPPCEVAPFEDTCVGVESNRVSSPDWSCASVASTGEGLPPAAFCTSAFEHSAPQGGVASPYAERNLDTTLQVVRVAFVHQGKLHVSDYPAPDATLYNPPNVEPLVACTDETSRNRCIHECELNHGRYEDPCACEAPEVAPDWGGDGEPEEESDEPDEVREAREAAAAAEREAMEAQLRAEEARKEVEYQECLASCEPEREEEESAASDSAQEGGPQPTSTVVTARLLATPSPGIFLVSQELQVLGARKEVVETSPLTVVLKHTGLVALWRNTELPSEEELGELHEMGTMDVITQEAGKPVLVTLPGVEGTVLVGMREGRVRGYSFKAKPGEETMTTLDPAVVCAGVLAEPKRFPQGVQDACAKPPPAVAPAQADAGADAGAPEAPVDAGPPGEATDAGKASTPGEVSP
jgi:hypothetical protein